jgi:tRNA-dihydrouridine synthase A
MGRAAYQEPWRLLAADALLFGAPAPFASAREAALALVVDSDADLAHIAA